MQSPGAYQGLEIEGRYRLESLLGEGGFGSVWRAVDLRMDQPVAVKVLHGHIADPTQQQRFEREAKTTSQLRHPNTIRVQDFGRMDSGQLYMVMEFLDGRPLTNAILRDAPFPPARAAHIALQICGSLAEAHAAGLVHRDLKPDNIFLVRMVDDPNHVKVLDFGVAKVLGMSVQQLTATGTVLGTPRYLSPEQATDKALDGRSDLYTLGVILYEMLAGCPPFEADSAVALVFKHVSQPPPDLTRLPQSEAPGFDQLVPIVRKLLEKKPEDRYPSALDVGQALQDALSRMPAYDPDARGPDRPVPSGDLMAFSDTEALTAFPDQATERGAAVASPKSAESATSKQRLATSVADALESPGRPERSARPHRQRLPVLWVVMMVALLLVAGAVFIVASRRGETQATHTTPPTRAPDDVVTLPDVVSLASSVPLPEPAPASDLAGPPSDATGGGDANAASDPIPDAVRIAGGVFWMGTDADGLQVAVDLCQLTSDVPERCQEAWYADEQPRHAVRLSPFLLDRTEVTQAQYAACVAAGRCTPVNEPGCAFYAEVGGEDKEIPPVMEGDDYPVVCVTHSQATAYCAWAGKRLPTEAEWELAAAGTDGQLFPWGSDWFADRANWGERGSFGAIDGYRFSAPVGRFPLGASREGALDLTGNVWEWVSDWYAPETYASPGEVDDPGGPVAGGKRIARGGSYRVSAGASRAQTRLLVEAGAGDVTVGFRCAASVPAP